MTYALKRIFRRTKWDQSYMRDGLLVNEKHASLFPYPGSLLGGHVLAVHVDDQLGASGSGGSLLATSVTGPPSEVSC